MYLANAVRKAGARYNRYAARKTEWEQYATRRNRFANITKLARDLALEIRALDVISRDDLAARLDSDKIETFLGSLILLSKETSELLIEAQSTGRPRDLAEERWIFELADIYENSFFEDARVWGSGGGPKKHRGRFYRMLEISRPEMFPRAGKLSVRQIDRMLKNRKNMKKQRPFEILNRMNKL
jgi:hypothetical protein